MLSCSTCWNSGRHTDGEAMLLELRELGFEFVELSHGIRLSLVDGIQRAFDKGLVRFSSLHNFCPLPVEITRASPDCYKFSADDSRERDRAVRLSCQTIDFAVRLGAPRVVLHLGRTSLPDYTDQLVRMAEAGGIHSRDYVKLKLQCVRRRETEAEAALERSKECLEKIIEYAAEHNVSLGFESRHKIEEIPSEREMLRLLREFVYPHVGYWHDFGHVQVKHNLGFLDHPQWLAQVAPRLIGCHLHDTVWPGNDHVSPFCGGIDYHSLIPLLPKDTLYVFEISPKRAREEIVAAREKWVSTFGA